MTDNTMEYMTVSMCGADALDWCGGYNEAVTKANEIINLQNAEIERLEYTLLGVMYNVDKWLDCEELDQDEVNRAITMREKTLQIVERLKGEVEMFADIGKMYSEVRAEAIKDFAEIVISDYPEMEHYLDILVKEMLGEQE